MIRRQFLTGALAVLAAPAVIRPGVLMPVRPLRQMRGVVTCAALPSEAPVGFVLPLDPEAWVRREIHDALDRLMIGSAQDVAAMVANGSMFRFSVPLDGCAALTAINATRSTGAAA